MPAAGYSMQQRQILQTTFAKSSCPEIAQFLTGQFGREKKFLTLSGQFLAAAPLPISQTLSDLLRLGIVE